MAHHMEMDDENIIQECRKNGFLCTYDPESSFRKENVTEAIEAVLKSRGEQAEKLGGIIFRTEKIMGPLEKLIGCMKELTGISDGDIKQETAHKDVFVSYKKRLIDEKDCLASNLDILKETQEVMKRKNIRVPVVGLINVGKSTFLDSALGNIDEEVKKNLFPSAGDHKSCTGTRTVLIYDDHTEGVTVTARFKDKLTFIRDCRQSVCRMIQILQELKIANQFPQIQKLKYDLTDNSDPIALLDSYSESKEFQNLCKNPYKNERDEESINDFCSFIYFSRNQDYSENLKGNLKENMKNFFSVSKLTDSWNNHTNDGHSMDIPPEHKFELVKKFVCKYDPYTRNERYTTYCGIKEVEIRGKLCEKIAGLELIDSVGANDDAISNEEQMKSLMQKSDAMILLKRPQSQILKQWTIADWIKIIKNQGKTPNQFLYLVYNCYQSNLVIPSDLFYDLDNAKKFYTGECKRIYVSDIGQWEEVQTKMLVDMLVNLSESVEETDRESINQAKEADSNISRSILAIRQIAEGLGQICSAEDENASEKKIKIEEIFRELFEQIEKQAFDTESETETIVRERANEITKELTSNLKLDFQTTDFNIFYEYISPMGPGYMHNRYVAFLCVYSRMLEEVKRQYDTLKDEINTYVGKKKQNLLDILWKNGRFQCVMSDLSQKDNSVNPSAVEICEWLKRDGRELLAGAFESLLLKDIRAERLIDESIGKIIEQFEPKNLTAEQLFGQKISDPNWEKSEDDKVEAISEQLSEKADELKEALMKSVVGADAYCVNMSKTRQRNNGKENDDAPWDDILESASKDSGKQADSKSAQNIQGFNGNLFDLDEKVRKDEVCKGIFKKFWDKLRGEGLPQNSEQPINQLYDLYYHYYDVLLTKEEAEQKKRLCNLRQDIIGLTKQLIEFCWN